MQKKHIVMVLGLAVGLAGAAAVDQWPMYAIPLQMTLYSVMTVGLVLMGLWSDRDRPGFLTGTIFVLAVHSVFLVSVRSYFPFRTIILVLPMALAEGTVLSILMLKMLRY